jgi:thioredoxin reductase
MKNLWSRRDVMKLGSATATLLLGGCTLVRKETPVKKIYDVLILGAGPAGLTSALTLSRGGREVIICDDGRPRNAPAPLMQNFPGHDGTPPQDLRNLIKQDLRKYDRCTLLDIGVERILRKENGFEARLQNGELLQSRKILLAHGVRDDLPEIAGVEKLWGKSIFHCPYCHGFEHRNEPIGFVINAAGALHGAAILRGFSEDVIIFTNGAPLPSAEELKIFERNGTKVYGEKIKSFHHDGEQLVAVELIDGTLIPRKALFLRPTLHLKSDLGINLGCKLNENGMYLLDSNFKTTEPGIYAAGDVAEVRQSVITAASTGCLAAAMLNAELTMENFTNW